MTEQDEYRVTEMMLRFGGSFVQALGKAYRLADAVNRARIRDAFPDYWSRYNDIAAQHLALNADPTPTIDPGAS